MARTVVVRLSEEAMAHLSEAQRAGVLAADSVEAPPKWGIKNAYVCQSCDFATRHRSEIVEHVKTHP